MTLRTRFPMGADATYPADSFIDPDGYLRCIDDAEQRLRGLLADQP